MMIKQSSGKVEIVGAGPSGLAAAITLRKAGYGVTVYEQHDEVGHRFHGDFQGIENWSRKDDALEQLKGMGIAVNFECTPYHGGTLYSPDRERIDVNTEKPLFYLVRRGRMDGSLDRGMKEQALDAGVEIVFNRKVEKITSLSVTAAGPKGADVIAKGITFETDLPDQGVAIFDDRLAPGAYAYLLVNKGKATMATALVRDYPKVNECFERTKEAFGSLIAFEIKNPREFGGFGNFFLWDKEAHGSHLYTGESAGFQDFLWGFGMRYAITSGFLAAQSIIRGVSYDRLWRERLMPTIRASMINRVLVDRFGHTAYRYMFRRISRGGDTRGFLQNLYGWNWWKRLLLPYALHSYKSRVKDERCRHPETCECVWCRCLREEAQ